MQLNVTESVTSVKASVNDDVVYNAFFQQNGGQTKHIFKWKNNVCAVDFS